MKSEAIAAFDNEPIPSTPPKRKQRTLFEAFNQLSSEKQKRRRRRMYIRSHLGSNQSAFLTSLMADSDSPPPDSESEDSAPPLVDSESEDSRDTWLAQPRTRTQSQHATEAAETYRDLMRAEYVLHKFHEICIKQNEFAAKDQMIWNKLAEKHQMIKTVEEIPLNEQQYKKCTLHERLLLKIHEYNKHRKKVALAEATIARDEDYQQDVTAEQFKKASEDKLGATQPHRRRPSTRPMSERKTTQRHCNKYRRWAATQCLELESNDSQDSSSVTVSDSDDENVAVTAKADAAEITKAETTNAEAASSAATVQARDSNLHSQLKKHFMDETPIWHQKLIRKISLYNVHKKAAQDAKRTLNPQWRLSWTPEAAPVITAEKHEEAEKKAETASD